MASSSSTPRATTLPQPCRTTSCSARLPPARPRQARLPSADRQKVAIARALLKRPAVLILDQAAASLDAGSQNRIVANVLEARAGRSVFWALQRSDLADRFGHTLVMERGRLAEQGRFADLKSSGGALHKILNAG